MYHARTVNVRGHTHCCRSYYRSVSDRKFGEKDAFITLALPPGAPREAGFALPTHAIRTLAMWYDYPSSVYYAVIC